MDDLNKQLMEAVTMVIRTRTGNYDYFKLYMSKFIPNLGLTIKTIDSRLTAWNSWSNGEMKAIKDFCEPKDGDTFKYNPVNAVIKNFYEIK